MRESQIRPESLFKKQEWVGEFHPPGELERRFAGRVAYSPNDGARLRYTVPHHIAPPECTHLHGVLNDTGIPCTAFADFSTRFLGSSGYSQFGNVGLEYFVIGEHLSPDDRYNTVTFSLTGLQEFFFQTGMPHQVRYEGRPLHSIDVGFGRIDIFQAASFNFLDLENIDGYIWSHEQESMEALRRSMRKLKADRPDAGFMLRNDVAYKFTLKSDQGFTSRDASLYVRQISELFALLRFMPTFPEDVAAFRNLEERTPQLQIYPWLGLNQSTIDLAQEERPHFHLPITVADVDLPVVVAAWLETRASFETIVSSIQYEIGFRTPHSAHGDLVLFATQLEGISKEARVPEKRKYEFPLESYCNWQLKDKLEKLFNKAGVTDIPIGISDLRNDIAHVMRRKKVLDKFNVGDLMAIARCLQLMVLSYVLEKLQISEKVRESYQVRLLPWTPNAG